MSDTTSQANDARLLSLTASIVAAHASNNQIAPEQLPNLITTVHRTLGGLGTEQEQAPAESSRREPAVPIRRSVRPDRITCLECGAKMKMLKRHLATEHGLTPETYRERWGLKRDYPMVAADYAETRSGLAKRSGLGRKRQPEDVQPEPEPVHEAVAPEPEEPAFEAPKKRTRGRRPKAATA